MTSKKEYQLRVSENTVLRRIREPEREREREEQETGQNSTTRSFIIFTLLTNIIRAIKSRMMRNGYKILVG
jgi:hypothetical protein